MVPIIRPYVRGIGGPRVYRSDPIYVVEERTRLLDDSKQEPWKEIHMFKTQDEAKEWAWWFVNRVLSLNEDDWGTVDANYGLSNWLIKYSSQGPGKPFDSAFDLRILEKELLEPKVSTLYRHQFQDADVAFTTFQEAQDKIISEFIEYREKTGEHVWFKPFVYLPHESCEDYYQLIKHPVSLKTVLKKVRGIHKYSGLQGSGDTVLKTWDAFEKEVTFIWTNARTYYKDESGMIKLAEEFKEMFEKRLEEAKSRVQEPTKESKTKGNKKGGSKTAVGNDN